MKYLELLNVRKKFGTQTILDGVSFPFPNKGFFAIVGDSGCGKSTLLDLLSGIDVDYLGSIFVLGTPWSGLSEEERCDFRLRNIGIARQSYDLLELETCLSNVLLPLEGLKVKKHLAKRKAKEILGYFGLNHKERQVVNMLSGGEKQRVALARALVTDPKIVLADEPTAALDHKNAEDVYQILKEISKDRLVIVVSHDLYLSENYADRILSMEEGKLVAKERTFQKEKTREYLTFVPEKEKKIHFHFSTWLKHAKHTLEEKKGRTMLMVFIVLFSLVALGLSLYVERDLQNELNNAFSSFSGINGIVMENNTKNEATFHRVYAAGEEKIRSIATEYPSLVSGYGMSYLCPFEDFFRDENEFYFSSFGKKTIIPSLTVRSINDYVWLSDEIVYPETPTVMEDEQMILGLPYSTMVNLCLGLHVQRNYESLGSALKKNPLDVYLETANSSWGYSDVHLFSLVGVTQSEIPTIYHLRHDWNEYVLEDCMGFPTSDEPDSSLPWMMQKVYYLRPAKDKEAFFREARNTSLLEKYVFERDSYDYDQSHNEKGKTSPSQKLYVYLADKISLPYEEINAIQKNYSFTDYALFGESSYVSFPSALTNGFAAPFFLSDRSDSVVEIAEGLSKIRKEESLADVSLKENVSMGYYLRPRNNALTLSSDFSKLIEGRKPLKMNEVCISSSLAEKFHHAPYLFCEGLIHQSEKEGYLYQDFRLGKLNVVGVVDESCETLYALPEWSIDYWRDSLGMSSFSLEPKKAIFYCDEKKSKEVLPLLSAHYPHLHFSAPSLTIQSSIANVVSYVEIALRFATVLTLATSAFLFLVCALLLGIENKREGRSLFELGVRRESIADAYEANVVLVSLLSSLLSFFSLFSAEFMMNRTIQNNFGNVSRHFQIDFIPIMVMAGASMIGLSIAVIFLHFWVKRRKFSREGGI